MRSIVADESWRRSLTPAQIADVESVASAALERYGYR